MNLRKLSIWLFFFLFLAVGIAVPLLAQGGEIILTVAVQEWQQDVFTDEAFVDFVAAHPNVKVVVRTLSQDSFFTPAQYNLESFQEGAAKYAASADVLLVSRYHMTPEFTRGGYLLDLAPLVAGDATLNVDDFYPAVWQSFQWDRGVWALPVSASVSFWIYNKTAFDEAGVTYPDENWTFQQLIDAARALTQRDADGNVTLPGFMTFDRDLMFRVFSSSGFYDPNTLPNQPLLQTPEIENLLAQYQQLVDEGISESSFNGSFEDIPLQIGRTWQLSQQGLNTDTREMAGELLPGGAAGLEIDAFAVSSGTVYPELAYELAKYLTLQPAIVNRFFADSPARRSLIGVETDDNQFFREVEPEVQALIDEALAGALPVSEMRFGGYLNMAIDKMSSDEIDPAAALQEAQDLALRTLQTIDDGRANQVVMVVTPVPTPVLSSGEIALKFRLSANISPLPNREQWDQLIADFTASDPQVRHIELDTGFGGGPDEEVDCYFQSFSPVTSMDISNPTILPLDPFMDADPDFDRNDLIPGVLEKMQRENKTWGFPVVIEPEIMWYNADIFAEAGVPLPTNGWTSDSFSDALRSIRPLIGTEPVFVPTNSGSTYLMMLFAAYGALPYDTRTNPPTLNLSDPAVQETMRQVLNLAKDGYIKYTELANFGGGGFGGSSEIPVYNDTLNTLNWRLQARNDQDIEGTPGNYQLTTFPTGTQFTPVAYNVSGAYISNTTLYPEACYRWISTIAARPDLFSAMPVRRSMFAEWGGQQGDDVLAVYQTIDAVLQSSNAVVLTGSFGNTDYFGSFIEQLWINRVFDDYVLNGTDELETAFAQVETDIAAYRVCLQDVGEFNPNATEEEQMAWSREFGGCAVSVDPSLAEIFTFPE